AVHGLVGDLDGDAQCRRQRLRPLGLEVAAVQRLDREATGDVTARVAAHPVGDDEETPARPEQLRIVGLEGADVVLVARANPAEVRDVSERHDRAAPGLAHHSGLRLPTFASLASTVPMSARTGGGAWRRHDSVAPSSAASRRTSSPARSDRPSAKLASTRWHLASTRDFNRACAGDSPPPPTPPP